jgi:hypothetical protein
LLWGGGCGSGSEGVETWVQVADKVVFPEAVNAKGHEVVHRVVG